MIARIEALLRNNEAWMAAQNRLFMTELAQRWVQANGDDATSHHLDVGLGAALARRVAGGDDPLDRKAVVAQVAQAPEPEVPEQRLLERVVRVLRAEGVYPFGAIDRFACVEEPVGRQRGQAHPEQVSEELQQAHRRVELRIHPDTFFARLSASCMLCLSALESQGVIRPGFSAGVST